MADSLRIHAHAKVNLYLKIVGKRPDGYHDIETIFHSIQLHDDVTLCKQPKSGISIRCDHPAVPCDERNLAYQAAKLLINHAGELSSVEISIEKRIPVAAGLAGGSADAAAVLYGMNQLFEFGLTQTDLMQLGAQLGADVPFCLLGGAARGRGIGEVLTPLPTLDEAWLVLANPGFAVPTGWAFENLDFPLTNPSPDVIIPIRCLQNGDIRGVAENMYNSLEAPVFSKHPDVGALKTRLADCSGSYGALMSGSGATVFSLMQDAGKAHQAASRFGSGTVFCTAIRTSKFSLYIA